MPPPDVLAAIGSLPARHHHEPSDKKQSKRKKKKKESHSESEAKKKKKKHKRSRHMPSSDEDSDSDSDPSTSSSSSDTSDSSTSSDDEHQPSAGRHGPSWGDASASSSHRRSHAMDDDMEENALARPMAKQFLRNVLAKQGKDGSVCHAFKHDVTFTVERNRRECLALAKVADALRANELDQAMELLVRRLAGVQIADQSNNWKLCDAFELNTDQQSFVPDSFMRRAVKNVMRLQALEKSLRRPSQTSTAHAPSKSARSFKRYKNAHPASSSTGGGSTSGSGAVPSSAVSTSHKRASSHKGGSQAK